MDLMEPSLNKMLCTPVLEIFQLGRKPKFGLGHLALIGKSVGSVCLSVMHLVYDRVLVHMRAAGTWNLQIHEPGTWNFLLELRCVLGAMSEMAPPEAQSHDYCGDYSTRDYNLALW